MMIKFQFMLILGCIVIMAGCKPFSEKVVDQSAGLNGGFEVSKNDLPVNWLMYTPRTVPNADFEIVLDKTTLKEGKQSLRFDVKKCNSDGGWMSPGFTNEFTEAGRFKGEGRYKLSFWIKNNGTKYSISAGGVEELKGDMKTLLKGNEQIGDWQLFEYVIDIPKDTWLRMELNILQPGIFWIDDIKIEKI